MATSQGSNVTATLHHRQQADESIADFAARVRQSYDCLSGWGAEYPLRAPVERFMRGLRVPRCREFVFYRRPKTLEEAVEAAEQFAMVDSASCQTTTTDGAVNSALEGKVSGGGHLIGTDGSTTAEVREGGWSTDTGRGSHGSKSAASATSLARRLRSAGVDPEIQRSFEILLQDLGCHQVREYDEAHFERHVQRLKDLQLEKTMKYEHSTIVVVEYRGFRVLNLCKVRPAYPLLSVRVRNPKWMQTVFNCVKRFAPSVTVPSEILG